MQQLSDSGPEQVFNNKVANCKSNIFFVLLDSDSFSFVPVLVSGDLEI